MFAPESTTNSLSSGFIVDAAGKTHSSEGKLECSLFRFFKLVDLLGKFPRVSAGASLLSLSLLLKSVLKFHSVRTSLMKKCDLYFIQRWTFVFSDVCLMQHSSCESYSSNWPQNFWALPRNRYRFLRLSVLWHATQLSHTVHNSVLHLCHHPSSACCWIVPQPSSAEKSTLRRIYIPLQTYRIDIREDANSHKVIYCKYLSRSFCAAVGWTSQTGLCFWSSFFSTHFYLLVSVAQKMEQLWVPVLHDHDSRVGNCIGLLSNTDLLLSTDSKFLFLFQCPFYLLQLVTTAPVSIFSFLASKFRNRSFRSVLLFTIVFLFW